MQALEVGKVYSYYPSEGDGYIHVKFLATTKKRVRVLRICDNKEMVVKPEALHDQQDLFADDIDQAIKQQH